MKMKPIESKHLSVYVILNPRREHVATVRVQYPRDGAGIVRADIITPYGPARERCIARYTETMDMALQSGRAGGYGYDKTTAALAGLVVDGHTLADHCGRVPEAEKARVRLLAAYTRRRASHDAAYWIEAARKIGASFANWQDGQGYTSLHFTAGLPRLAELGYTIIEGI
jgi:hypothetical protein